MPRRQATHSVANNGRSQMVQTKYEQDDDLLPKAEELKKYQELDPKFIDWIKNRCDIEQNSRIEFKMQNLRLAKSTNNMLFSIDLTTIFLSTLLVFCFLYFSYLLVMAGHEKIGSLLGAAGIFTYAIRLLKFRRDKQDSK